MSGVLRRGSLNFNLNSNNARGSVDSNLYGGFRDAKPQTPEISVISLDLRRYSEDLKKDTNGKLPPLQTITTTAETTTTNGNTMTKVSIERTSKDYSQDDDSDIISNYIHHYGRWQFWWTFALSLFQLPTTFHMFAFIFQTADKDFWCTRPDHMTNMSIAIWRNLTHVNKDACHMHYINSTSMKCTEFDFDHSHDDGKTLVEEFNLVCDRRQLLSVVEMCFLVGVAVGSVLSSWISDRFGRKHTLMGFALVQTVFGCIAAFSTSLAMYMSLRVIIGFASMTVTVVSFVLVVEFVSGKWRTIVGILNILPVALTYVLTTAIAYFIRDWRQLQMVISLPEVLLLCIWYWLPESPRWLLAHGHLDELYKIIERAASMNRIQLPSNYRKSLEAAAPPRTEIQDKQQQQQHNSIEEQNEQGTSKILANPHNANNVVNIGSSVADTNECKQVENIDSNANPLVVVFGKAYLRITCLSMITWLTLIIIYFGLTLHLSNLGGNIYVNTAIAGSVEAVSIILSIFVVLKLGIRRNLIAFMLIPGFCCLAANFVPSGDDNVSWVITLAMIAKCVIGATNAIIPTYTAMQYPTVVRNFGVGMGNLAAGIGLIIVPYMWLLEHIEPLLPMTIMGVCGIIGAVALMLMKDAKQ